MASKTVSSTSLTITDNVGSITGTVAAGGFTDDTTLTLGGTATVTGTGSAASIKIWYSTNGGAVTLLTTVTNVSTTWTFTTTALTDANFTFYVTDGAVASWGGSSLASQSLTLDTAAPTVTSITYGTNDGNLALGEAVTLSVSFSEIVNVTGTPTIALANGGTATYTSGGGSNVLTFTYTPAAGQTTSDLATAVTAALTGTIADRAGNAVVASGFNNVNPAGTLAVDVTAPTVSSIAYGTNDGNLAVGETVTLSVTFSEAVTVTGTPTIALANGGTASYSTGSGTNTLTFTYTPAAGQDTSDLATAASAALSGTIKDAAGNAVVASGFNGVNPSGTLAVDATGPSAPVITSIVDNVDPGQGTIASGDSSNDTTPTLSGTAEANSTVKIYDGASFLGSTTADGSGNWSYTTSSLSYATHDFTATAVDAAGNVSAASSVYQDVIDANAVCFLKGTRIRTAEGEVAVEKLAIGDLVLTHSGESRRVKWIGRRSYVTRFLPAHGRRNLLPIRICAGALADGVPARDLFVSPEHAMFVDGALIPTRHLVNGRSISYFEALDTIEYYHIELPEHDLVIAEGAPTESWLDCGNRNFFMNVVDYLALGLPDEGRKQPCRPFLAEGPELQRIRARVTERAVTLGFGMTADPDMHLLADGQRVSAESGDNRQFRFKLARCPAKLMIGSRSVTPADINPTSTDARQLGVSLTRLVLRSGQTEVRLGHDHPLLTDGFHEPEPSHRWTTGRGIVPRRILELLGSGPLEVEVHIGGLSTKYPHDAGQAAAEPDRTRLRLVA